MQTTASESLEVVVYQSARTRIVRRPDGDTPVLVKEPRGPGAVQRLHHEHAVLRRLAGVDGIQQLAVDAPVDGSLVLADSGGVALALVAAGRFAAAGALVDLAAGLAAILAAMHRRGVVHRDVNPANIVVDPHTLRPTLIDFDLATTSVQEILGFTAANEVSGTLPYIAPEQTGRTGWPVDHRVDLYGLGATLYELATGAPPFGRGEALDVIRGHLLAEPRPVSAVNDAVPPALSAVIGRLLAKEPDRRYQTADGLLHDLTELRDRLATGRDEPFEPGRRDFPLRLTPAARPVGRSAEIDALAGAFEAAATGPGTAVLVTGPPGVGKSTVIDQLRPLVTARNGWYAAGKFDEHRRDRAADGLWRALRALGRLLLAEPDAELAAHRALLRDRLGPNAALIAAAVGEFETLLGVEPEPLDTAGTGDVDNRLTRAATDVVTALGSAGRPLVLVVDDLQWAGPTAIGVLDAIVTERPAGVLLVGAYRDAEVDAVHPLTATLARWARSEWPPVALRLTNLPPSDVQTLLADMLRLPYGDAREPAEAIGARSGGNPFDTVELVNALRRDGSLTPSADGWEFDLAAIRRYVGAHDVLGVLAARVGRLPAPTRTLLEVLACLGDRAELAVLATASGSDPRELEEVLQPALEDGLLVLETGGDRTVLFRHDRVREAAYANTGPDRRATLHHDVARRLAARPETRPLAAEQYLAAVTDIDDAGERSAVAGLLRTAAADARLTDPGLAEELLAAAADLLGGTGDAAALAAVQIDHHAVLCGQGRFDEADRVYAVIEQRDPEPLERAAASHARIAGLRSRNRQAEALALGLDVLGRLGVAVPGAEDLPAEIDRGIGELGAWVASGEAADDLARPEVTDPAVLAAARVIEQILPVAYFSGNLIFAWLVSLARRMWAEHGPCRDLVAPLSHAGFMTIMLRQDYRTGYEATRRVLTVGETRGWKLPAAHARFLFALAHGPWFEPVPAQLETARRGREGLQLHGSGLAAHTFFASVPLALDCAPSVEAFHAEVEAALGAARRIGDVHTEAAYVGYRQLARALRGETNGPGALSDDSVDMTAHFAELAANPTATANAHTVSAVAAAVFGDTAALVEHGEAAFALLPFINATYLTATARLVHALGVIEQVRHAADDERTGARARLDTCRAWFAGRAADAPGNFAHLAALLDAEAHHCDGDRWAAAAAFDEALRLVLRQQRPWHHGLIAERAGRFYRTQGLAHMAHGLLAEARNRYAEWGASGKVLQLDDAFADLPAGPVHRPGNSSSTVMASSAIDIMVVLDASRALSSATGLSALRTRLADVLGAMTGATEIRLLMWEAGAGEWALRSAGEVDDEPLLLGDPGVEEQLPVSVIRYVQRTGEPLLVVDAVTDDRFARDPYLDGLDSCSIMAVPIASRGVPQALLLLEKPQARGAFTADRLDTVTLVAGQLAVSIENAVVYHSLERKVTERTRALASANERLEELNRTDALTGLANRRRMEDTLAAEWERSLSTGTPISVVMIDIDFFKQYNDHYGHLGGDQCLRTVAEALSAGIRATDLLARYGGEEFCLILPGADLAVAEGVAERARLAVAVLQEQHAKAPCGFVTVSLGVASVVPTPGGTAEELVQRADEGLYEAKRSGRNRVGVHQR